MRGNAKIINSMRDAQSIRLTYDQAVSAATIVVRYDDAEYPDDYDSALKDGDDGYVEPIWRFEEEINQAVLDRFGFSG
ncbi:hypothetical protein G6Z92_05735 [Vibrio aestuarianus subsp. cardii]|uniref:hypothetical protein n=1 Tax=Vibrio aestuarianus TaxID=28171 RepID=UPI0015C57C9A|nr:hypothetical protein [Vibrio aestuarianus]NGZ66487.1 hypothetical protein [Vibrio aestuarianus subsp. cardii]